MNRRQRTLLKRIALAISVVISLPLLVMLVGLVIINPNNYRPDIANALQKALGRKVEIGGQIAVDFGMSPTITVYDLRISNPPGFSRDNFAIIDQASVKVSLPSLIFGKPHIRRFSLMNANVLAETNPLGETNTVFGPASDVPRSGSGSQPANSPERSNAAAATPTNPLDKVRIDEVSILTGSFASRDDVSSTRHELLINRAVFRVQGAAQSVSVIGDVAYDKEPLSFTLETGALGRLFGQNVGPADWPLTARAQSNNSTLSIEGSIRNPLAGQGYQMIVAAAFENLADISPIVGHKLPPVHDLRLNLNLRDNNGVPELTSLLVRSGASDLGSYAQGLSLDHLVLSAPSMSKPMHGDVVGQFGNQPLTAKLDIGATQDLITAALKGREQSAGPDVALPISIDAQVAGARLRVNGQVAKPTKLAGLDLGIVVDIPDLTVFSALVGEKLPALKNLAFSTNITDAPTGLANGISLRKINFGGSLGDLSGDLDILVHPRKSLKGEIVSKRFDLDALQMAADAAKPGITAANVGASQARRAGAPARYVLSETNIDFAPLINQDVDLTVALGELQSGGVFYRDIAGHVLLNAGKLTVDPFTASLPGGKFMLQLAFDTQSLPPTLALKLYAPGLALKPLLTAFHQPDDVIGTMEVGADLVSSGRSPHQLGSQISGKLGVSMADGEMDNRILGAIGAQVMRAARLPGDMLSGNSTSSTRTKLSCVAMRIDAERGLASLSNMVVQTSAAQITGSGSINFGDEAVTMRLRPALRTAAGPSVVVPVRVAGFMVAPQVTLDPNAVTAGLINSAKNAAASGVTALIKPSVSTLGAVMSDTDPCPPGLEAARGVRPLVN